MSRATPPRTGRELTYEEYLATPEMKRRHEVIDGVMVMSPSPGLNHQLILQNLSDILSPHVRSRDLGTVVVAPTDLLIRKRPKLRVRQPDLMFVARERATREDLRRLQILELTPNLAVEIIPPSDRTPRWTEKLADYALLPVPEIWRVEPENRAVEVLVFEAGRYTLKSRFGEGDDLTTAVIPGLAFRVASLFD